MKRTWEIDESTLVAVHYGLFRRSKITVNGVAIPGKLNVKKKRNWRFSLRDGRKAQLWVIPQFVGQPTMELRIDERMMLESGKQAVQCRACGAAAKPYDSFCGKCGQAMPPPQLIGHEKLVKQATQAIYVLAVLFLVSGLLLYSLSKENTAQALAKLQTMDPDQVLPQAIDGVTYTVRELRSRLQWESTGTLVANLILAAAMAALGLWSKRAPLAAIVVATALYLVVLVVATIVDPASLTHGLILKIVVVAVLFKGVKSALAVRDLNA